MITDNDILKRMWEKWGGRKELPGWPVDDTYTELREEAGFPTRYRERDSRSLNARPQVNNLIGEERAARIHEKWDCYRLIKMLGVRRLNAQNKHKRVKRDWEKLAKEFGLEAGN